ncbi:DUF7144 family membrane protein [Nocardioides sediminis]|uniref:DUF7144 family membrane protein n=1 Tax=Nocardioides sediminis TaxID=433648 RepID=UPI000D3278BE|nr:hypothetical protein [Nocardioides sediminis]
MTGAGASTSDAGRRRTSSRAAVVVGQFAAVMLLVTASVEVLQGVEAIRSGELLATSGSEVYEIDLTVWGWIHVVIGVLLVAVAVGILRRRSWGQVTGLVVAGLSMLANFAFLPYYPWWSVVSIAFGGLVVWALCTQLRDAA